jgi:hypothetical protein
MEETMLKHITLVLPNRYGEFYSVAQLLAESEINVIGHNLSSEGKTSILHLLCDPHDRAFKILSKVYRYYCAEKQIVTVQVEHKPGQLLSILRLLNEEQLNLHVSYQAFRELGTDRQKVMLILEYLDASDAEKAREALKAASFDGVDSL